MFELILICYLSVGMELTNFGDWSLKSVQGLDKGAMVEITREVEDGYTLKIPGWCQVVRPMPEYLYFDGTLPYGPYGRDDGTIYIEPNTTWTQ